MVLAPCKRATIAVCLLHHDLPCVDGQVCIVEGPIELLLRDRLIGWVVVRGQVWVCKRLLRSYTLLGVKDQHVL